MKFQLTLSLSLVARGKSRNSDLEERRSTNVVPLFFDERVEANDKKEE